MSKKQYGNWRGRPNPPPLNWDSPHDPIMRRVSTAAGLPDRAQQRARPDNTGGPARLPVELRKKIDVPRLDSQPLCETNPDDVSSVIVTLTNRHWICILQALYHFNQSRGEHDGLEWRRKVRHTILNVVNWNPDVQCPVAVRLTMSDWRIIWQKVPIACQELGQDWVIWFNRLSHVIVEQLKKK